MLNIWYQPRKCITHWPIISLESLIWSGQGNLRGELCLFFNPVLTLWSDRHITGYVWRRVIVPSDSAQSFGAIYVHNRYRMIHHTITNICAWFRSCGKGNSHLLGGLRYKKKSGGTISLLHTWPQDGCRNISPPLNFLGRWLNISLQISFSQYTNAIHAIPSVKKKDSNCKFSAARHVSKQKQSDTNTYTFINEVNHLTVDFFLIFQNSKNDRK